MGDCCIPQCSSLVLVLTTRLWRIGCLPISFNLVYTLGEGPKFLWYLWPQMPIYLKFPVNMKIPKKTSFLNFVKSNVLSNLFHEKNLGSNPSPQFLVFNFKGKVIFTKMLYTRLYKVVEKPNLLAK